MTVQNSTTLKSFFETGDLPTQSNFEDLIDTVFGQGFINAQTYGVSAASTDNYAAFKAAISAANGRWIYVPATAGPTTYLTTTVSTNTGARFWLDKNVTIKQKSGSNRDLFFFNSGAHGFSFNGGGTLDANKAENSGTGVYSNVIHAYQSHGFDVSNVKINNAIGSGFRIVSCSAWNMQNIDGGGNVVNGLYTIGTSANGFVENFHVDGMYFRDTTGGDSFSIDGGTRNGQFSNLRSRNSLVGLVWGTTSSALASPRPYNLQFNNVEIEEAFGTGLACLPCRDIQANNIKIHRSGYSAGAGDEAHGSAVSFKIHDNGGGIPAPTQNIDNVQITNLIIDDAYEYGIDAGIADGSGLEVNDVSFNGVIIKNPSQRTANGFDAINIEASGGTVNRIKFNNVRISDTTSKMRYALNVPSGVSGNLFNFQSDNGQTGIINNASKTFYTNSMIDQTQGVFNQPICVARLNTSAGGANLVGPSVNVSAVQRFGTGDYIVKYKQDVSSANDTIAFATAYIVADQGPRTAQIRFLNTNEVRVQVFNSAATIDPTGLMVCVYGKHG